MVAYAKAPFVTVQEYLELEKYAVTRSEYLDGIIVAMAGASEEHDRTSVDILTSLNVQLRGAKCETFSSNMRVRVQASNRYFYPDVTVACGGSKFETIAGVRTLQNPTLIVEVLSDSTEKTDRGDKLLSYQSVPSVQTYVIVAQDRPLVQVYERQSDNSWNYNLHEGLDAMILLPAIGCKLSLAEIYARVEFPPSETGGDELQESDEQ